MKIFDFRAFHSDPNTGKKIIKIDDFSILRLGSRPENFYEFKILYQGISAYFVAIGTIHLDSCGNGTGFSWEAISIRFDDGTMETRSDLDELKIEIIERVRRFLKAYCPGIKIYPFVNYSESPIFSAWRK